MTFRQKLYEKLPVWLAYINPENGYTNTLKHFYKGRVPQSANNTNLQTYFYLGQDDTKELSESEYNAVKECTLFIGIHYKPNSNDEGKLSDLGESLLSDVYKFFYRGSGITAGKWFFADSEQAVTELACVQGFTLESIIPYPNFADYNGELFIQVKIKYYLEA